MSNEKDMGKSSSDMTVSELKALAVSLELLTVDEAKGLKKPELLKIVKKWEKAKIEEMDKADLEAEEEVEENIDLGEHMGKKVTAKVAKEVNGNQYTELTVEDGSTYLVPNNEKEITG